MKSSFISRTSYPSKQGSWASRWWTIFLLGEFSLLYRQYHWSSERNSGAIRHLQSPECYRAFQSITFSSISLPLSIQQVSSKSPAIPPASQHSATCIHFESEIHQSPCSLHAITRLYSYCLLPYIYSVCSFDCICQSPHLVAPLGP
jgi:hypothetical protein